MGQSDDRHAERFAQYWKRTCIDARKMNIDIGKRRCYTLDSVDLPQFDKHFFHAPYNSLKQGKISEEVVAAIDGYIMPHLGYAHVRGMCKKQNGSRYNQEEAECIVKWVKANINRLKQYYLEKACEEIDEPNLIAIVTPFAAQAKLIKKLLNDAGKKTLTAGTTHALQGAEKKVVIFSPVYDDRSSQRHFFDGGVNMLNVAVSRAQDSFLVFGNMNVFRNGRPGSPSWLLGEELFKSPDNEITNIQIPPMTVTEGAVYVLDTVEKHTYALRRAIREALERVIIYSPWLSVRAVEADRLDAIIKTKLNDSPCVTVTIYTDKDNNNRPETIGNYRMGKDRLEKAGAKILELEKIHQKIVIVDNSKYMVGSFNWLSTSRKTNPGEPHYQENRTIVYSGPKVSQMIEEELKYISCREKGFDRS